MKTWRWDLFYEIDHMETMADERTARLEARRNRMLVRIWPWMMLIAWFVADAFCGGRIEIMFMLTIYIPVLGNNLLALKEGTFCTDDDKLDERSVRTNAKVELLAHPLVLLWWFFVILSKQWMLPHRRLWALAPAVACTCVYWVLEAMAHGHYLWAAQEEGEEILPPSRRERLIAAVWTLSLAASAALTVMGLTSAM